MINQEDLVRVIEEHNMVPVRLRDVGLRGICILEDENISSFIELVKLDRALRIYYCYFYFDSLNFKINYQPRFLSSRAISEIESYNNLVDTFDFAQPYKLLIFTKIDSMQLGIELISDWPMSSGLRNPSELYEEIKSKYEDDYYVEVAQRRKEQRELFKQQKEEITKLILNDPEFQYKKNQESRYWYYIDFIQKPGLEKYKELLLPHGSPVNGNVKMFMDYVWRIFKEMEK